MELTFNNSQVTKKEVSRQLLRKHGEPCSNHVDLEVAQPQDKLEKQWVFVWTNKRKSESVISQQIYI